ncbi:MAG: N-formylglutamate deformylase [Gammaproteobacteria bacterium]
MSFTLTRGHVPLLISFPHSGTHLPASIASTMTDHARTVPDTDWHVPALYAFARSLGAWTLEAHLSRYVIDLNRDPTDTNLYPGQSTTSLCPVDTFEHQPVYQTGREPTTNDIEQRVTAYWQPYHSTLDNSLNQLKREHGYAVLYDAHSIRSQVPRFFDGTLSDLNLGTARGASCGKERRDGAVRLLEQGHWSAVVDQRFVGGYITRHYGDPANNVHAVQMEIAQSAYMSEDSDRALQPLKARALSAQLQRLCEFLLQPR